MLKFFRAGLNISRFASTNLTSKNSMITPFYQNNEKSLFQCNVTLKTSKNELVDLRSVFFDSMPNGSQRGTVLMIHGAPGSYKDFKYITPYLIERNIRVIGVNFPGMGYSSYDERLQNDNVEREQFLQQLIEKLNVSEKLLFVGHSRGCYDTMMICAQNIEKAVGIMLINTVGLRIHRGARPFWVMCIIAWLWSFSLLRFVLSPLLYLHFNKILGLRTTGEAAAIITQIIVNTNFSHLKNYIKKIDQSGIPVVVPFSGNDSLIETEISRELTQAFTAIKELDSSQFADSDEITSSTINFLKKGERHLSIFFPKENHFLQKHRAEFLANTIDAMLTLESKNELNLK